VSAPWTAARPRIGGGPDAARTAARKAYPAALFRARAQRSIDGTRRAADAFARLGDRDVTEGASQ
jgi:hypothetical protein